MRPKTAFYRKLKLVKKHFMKLSKWSVSIFRQKYLWNTPKPCCSSAVPEKYLLWEWQGPCRASKAGAITSVHLQSEDRCLVCSAQIIIIMLPAGDNNYKLRYFLLKVIRNKGITTNNCWELTQIVSLYYWAQEPLPCSHHILMRCHTSTSD